jgi:uncharacterized protein with HEPN domain
MYLGRIIEDFISEEGVKKEMSEFIDPLADIAMKVEKLTKELGLKAMMDPEEVGAAAVPYLRIIGHLMTHIYSHVWQELH